MIEYTFVWPHAGTHVNVTGTFDNWTQSVTLAPSDGTLSLTVPIPVEKTLFKFVVDGEWKVDESFATETDEHGNVNNVLTVEVLEKLEGDDIQEITQDIPGAFPVDEEEAGVAAGAAAAVGGAALAGGAAATAAASGTAAAALSGQQHDLQPSKLDPGAASELSKTLETKREAVSGGGFVPADAEPSIPAASTSSEPKTVTHDLQPSHLDPQAQSKLENALESKIEAVESGELAPVAGINRDEAQGQDVPEAVAQEAQEHAVEDAPIVPEPQSKSVNPAVPVASYGFDSSGPSAAHADIPAAAAAAALTMHDLQPSALDPDAEATLDQTISTKYSAVESGAISPVDSTGQSRAVPSTPTRDRHDSEYDHVTELRDEAYNTSSVRSRDKGKARDDGVVPPSPGIGSGFDEVKPKKKEVGDAGDAGEGSRFHENETAPPSPTPMSPHLAGLAQREGLPVEGGAEPGAEAGAGASGVAAESEVATGAGAAIPVASSLDPSAASASSVHSAAATKSVAPGTPSSTALNLNVPVGQEGAAGAASIADSTAAPVESIATAPATAPVGDIVAAHASVASAPATAADVTITAGTAKKEKRRSIFRKIKDKMF
ncbi:hypothetical protein CKK34_3725 [Yarrowia sp. E02]|nr:hypothetical protein CKK34_3725 [Yarrowia sp. E02]